MDANANLQLQLGLMLDGETFHRVQNGQRHQSDFARMIVAVALRQTGHHHVRVADCLDLGGYSKRYVNESTMKRSAVRRLVIYAQIRRHHGAAGRRQ